MTDHKPQIANTINKMLLVVKSSSLYPQGHDILVRNTKEFIHSLKSYLKKCNQLIIGVDRNRLLSDGDVLYEGNMNQENIAYMLHRDGIQWLSFQSGIETDEITLLLEIFKRYRADEENDGDDIVTALWQADFTHIKYGVADTLWADEPLIDLAKLKVLDADQSSTAGKTQEHRGALSLASSEQPEVLWTLSEREIEQTKRMISEEDKRDKDSDLFEILLIILDEQNEKDDYTAVLDLVRECFQRTLAHGEFEHGLDFLRKLAKIHIRYKKDRFCALPHLADFYTMISNQYLYTGLLVFFRENKKVTHEKMLTLMRIISLLPPLCINSLGMLLPDMNSPSIRRYLIKAMGIQALRNMGPLANLTNNENQNISLPAIGLLGHIKRPRAVNVLRRHIHSEQEATRIAAVNALIRNPLSEVNDFEGVLNDPDNTIIDSFLGYLRKQRNADAEDIVTDHLISKKFNKHDENLLLKLYETLGNCGSIQSLPFLQRQLFKFSLFSGKVDRFHRTGSAIALFHLKQKEALLLLKRASKSFRFSVKNAFRNARDIIHEPAK